MICIINKIKKGYAMKTGILLCLSVLVLLAGCSKESAPPEQSQMAPTEGDASSVTQQRSVATTPLEGGVPAQPQELMESETAEATAPPLPEHVGVVLDAIAVAETRTMYIQLESSEAPVWIATKSMDVKKGDKVRYALENAVVMENFESKRLGRTFERVLLVPSAEKVTAAEE
jgi:hypothetical protein